MDALTRLDPVGLDDLVQSAELLTRVDRKYVLPLGAAERLVADLAAPRGSGAAPRVLEIDGERASRYRSVYIDTPELLSFRLAAHGRRRRFKLRTRTYLDTDAAFLEIKTRGAHGVTEKDRVVYAPADAGRLTAPARDAAAEALASVGVDPGRADDLRPVLLTAYRRATLLTPGAACGDGASRATIDTELEWIASDGTTLALPMTAIVETKSPGRASTVDRALWRAGYRPSRISKYATGVAALDPRLPRNRWTRVLRGPFADAVGTGIHPSTAPLSRTTWESS